MQSEHNRDDSHNKTYNRQKVDKNEGQVLLSLFQNKNHRQLAMLYYIEGYTLEKCAEIMFFSKRHIERIKSEMDKIALFSLLNIVANSQNALKLAKIKKILLDGEV